MTSIKKLLSVVLALAMLLCVLPISVSAEETATEPISFVYDFNSEASLAAFHAYYLPVTGYWDNMVGTAEELARPLRRERRCFLRGKRAFCIMKRP